MYDTRTGGSHATVHATEKIVQVAEWTTLRERIPQYAGSGATTNARTCIEGATLQELPRPSSASMPRNRGNQRRYRDMDAPAEIADRLQKGLDAYCWIRRKATAKHTTAKQRSLHSQEAGLTTTTVSVGAPVATSEALRFTAEPSLIISLAIDERLVSSTQQGNHS